MRKRIDKESAVRLRQSGKTYRDISLELGCSIAWCEKNLKHLKSERQMMHQEIVQEVQRRGRSTQGVTTGEIRALVLDLLPQVDIEGQDSADVQNQHEKRNKDVTQLVEKIKAEARRDNTDVIIRPYWVVPECAQDSINTMHDMAQEVYELHHELARKYREAYDLDESYQRSIVYELSRLSAPLNSPLLPQGFFARGEQLTRIAEVLGERNFAEKSRSRPLPLPGRVTAQDEDIAIGGSYHGGHVNHFDDGFDDSWEMHHVAEHWRIANKDNSKSAVFS